MCPLLKTYSNGICGQDNGGRMLASVQTVDYPKNLYEVIVVADNCDDNTEKIALHAGVTCWQRRDPDNCGKGNVLRWVFPRLLEYGNHGAYVVIGADTHMEKDFLQWINHHFCHDAKAVQGYSQVRHPEDSPMESLAFLGFALNRNLRYRGRSRLGWTSNLMGTGMCFFLSRYTAPRCNVRNGALRHYRILH